MPDMTNMFLLIVLLICIANNLHVTNGQGNTKKDCQAGANADSCLMKLLMIGDPDYKFPENMASMDKQCRTYKNQEKCIKDYAAKCLATFPKQVTNVLAYGASKTNKAYCSTKRRKDSFIAIGKCGNKLKFLVDKCMRQFIDSLQGIENYQDAKMKIPISCW
ncbi:unnamed protein product [Oppiella nova]|uniref:DUF19 domain-containing protein n=1 Tax=Oppiella nova TaxID=334625 RepID=A0A7R9M2C1_9ACAR|nr:unnamed protein product [Oppiella nova]CAG2169331.1 unnamed protein product [Oppiella nova]